jgi:hypothetical protein
MPGWTNPALLVTVFSVTTGKAASTAVRGAAPGATTMVLRGSSREMTVVRSLAGIRGRGNLAMNPSSGVTGRSEPLGEWLGVLGVLLFVTVFGGAAT